MADLNTKFFAPAIGDVSLNEALAGLSPTNGSALVYVDGEWVAVQGASGSFEAVGGETITVTNGIITAITP